MRVLIDFILMVGYISSNRGDLYKLFNNGVLESSYSRGYGGNTNLEIYLDKPVIINCIKIYFGDFV